MVKNPSREILKRQVNGLLHMQNLVRVELAYIFIIFMMGTFQCLVVFMMRILK